MKTFRVINKFLKILDLKKTIRSSIGVYGEPFSHKGRKK